MITVERGNVKVNGNILVLMAEVVVAVKSVAETIKEVDIEEIREKLLKNLSDDVIDAIYLTKEEFINRQAEQILEELKNVLKNESPEES